MVHFNIIHGGKYNFHPNYFHQKLYSAIFKWQISGGGDNLAAVADIVEEVAVVVWRLRSGGGSCGAVTATSSKSVRQQQ